MAALRMQARHNVPNPAAPNAPTMAGLTLLRDHKFAAAHNAAARESG
jgi:hypothetical protein